jgi:hypothetical protein
VSFRVVFPEDYCSGSSSSTRVCDSDQTAAWTLVRHTDGNTHPADDNLCGTAVYGTAVYGTAQQSASWSVDFEEAVPEYDQFMFASRDCEMWIVMTKEEAIGSDGMREYANAQLNIMRGSASDSAYTTNGFRRRVCGEAPHEDPWIQHQGTAHNQCDAIYINNNYAACGGNGVGALHGGLDVYVRNSAAPVGINPELPLLPSGTCSLTDTVHVGVAMGPAPRMKVCNESEWRDHDLICGECKVRVPDLTMYEGRCDKFCP